jgi:nucleoside-diphosphate-sugar epimerase
MILNRMAAAAIATKKLGRQWRFLRLEQQPLLFCLLLLLTRTSLALSSSSSSGTGNGLAKVAVIGTTGRLGRQLVQQLSSLGLETRCLLRHDLTQDNENDGDGGVVQSLADATTSKQVATYLNTLPGVQMIQGDVADVDSLRRLLLLNKNGESTDCVDACFAVYGAVMPKPFYKGLFPQLLFKEDSDPLHPKQVNYKGVQNILTVLQECKKNKPIRLVRITGKGETPWSIFSILINALGGMAKAWNYEAEQLIRSSNSNIDYTIIRPGILNDTVDEAEGAATLGFLDNGGDLPVTAVSYAQIANLVIDVAKRDNCQRATITAMNIKKPASTSTGSGDKNGKDEKVVVYQTLDQVQPDSRTFPATLLQEHKRAARVGGIAIIVTTLLLANLVASLVLRLFGFS